MARPVCAECGKPMRFKSVLLIDAPGTVAVGAGGLCATDYQRGKRPAVRPPKPRHAAGSFAAMASTPEDMATVARMVSARFPNEPELLRMLGVDG